METDTKDVILARLPPNFRAYVVLGAASLFYATIGVAFTFGNMVPYLTSYMRWKVDPTLDTGSLMWVTSFPFAYLVGGCLERAVGTRISVIIGCVIYLGSLASCAFTINFGVIGLVLSLGVGSSLGIGIASNCVLIEAQRWMPGYLGFAGAIISSSSAIGGFFLAPFQTLMINPRNLPLDNNGYFTQTEILERIPRMFLVITTIFAVFQIIAAIFMGRPCKTEDADIEDIEDASVLMEQPLISRIQTPSVNKQSALSSATFWAFAGTYFFQSASITFVGALYKAFGETFIDDDFFLSTITSYSAVVSCVSQIFFGVFASKMSYRTSMSLTSIIGAFAIWAMLWIKQIRSGTLYLIACILSASGGVVPAMLPYGVHKCFGAENFGIIYGSAHIGTSAGNVISALIAELLLPLLGISNMVVLGGICNFAMFMISLFAYRTRYGAQLAVSNSCQRRKYATCSQLYGTNRSHPELGKDGEKSYDKAAFRIIENSAL